MCLLLMAELWNDAACVFQVSLFYLRSRDKVIVTLFAKLLLVLWWKGLSESLPLGEAGPGCRKCTVESLAPRMTGTAPRRLPCLVPAGQRRWHLGEGFGAGQESAWLGCTSPAPPCSTFGRQKPDLGSIEQPAGRWQGQG